MEARQFCPGIQGRVEPVSRKPVAARLDHSKVGLTEGTEMSRRFQIKFVISDRRRGMIRSSHNADSEPQTS